MIDATDHWNDEDPGAKFFHINDVPKHFPWSVSKPTVRRWISRGVRGAKLKTELQGGRRFCCQNWVEDFLLKLNQDKQTVVARTPSSRNRAHRIAKARLAKEGI